MSISQMPSAFQTKAYHQRQTIFHEGQDGSYACIINQGRVEVTREVDGQKVTLAELGRGDLFGEMALICTEKRTASVVALEYTEVVIFDRDRLTKALDASTPLLNNLVRSLIQRLASTTGMVRQQASPPDPMLALAHLAQACMEPCPPDAQGYHNLPLAKLTDHAGAILRMPPKTVKEHLRLLARHHLLILERVGEGVTLRVKAPMQLAQQATALAESLKDCPGQAG